MNLYDGIIIAFSLLVFGCSTKQRKPIQQVAIYEHPTIPVGKGCDALFLVPNGQFLYVANVEDTTISVINTANEKALENISGIRNPLGFVRLGKR